MASSSRSVGLAAALACRGGSASEHSITADDLAIFDTVFGSLLRHDLLTSLFYFCSLISEQFISSR